MSEKNTKSDAPAPQEDEKAAEKVYVKGVSEFKKTLDKQKKRKIKIWGNPDEQNPLPEIVTINGCRYQIQKGVEVEVPELVAEVLEQAGRI